MLASAGPETQTNQSLSMLVKEDLARAARGESGGVYAELLGTLEREFRPSDQARVRRSSPGRAVAWHLAADFAA